MQQDLSQVKKFLERLRLPCLLVEESGNIVYANTSGGGQEDPEVLHTYEKLFSPILSRLSSEKNSFCDIDPSICFEVDPSIFGVGPFLKCNLVPIGLNHNENYFILFFSDATCATVLDHLPIVSLYSPLDDILNIRFATSGLEKWTGISLDRFIKDPDTYRLLIHPEDRARVNAFLQGISSKKDEEREWTVSYRLTHTDGSYRWIEHRIMLSPGSRGSGDCYSMLRDITVKKQIEFRLSDSEDRCKLFFEKGPLGFLCIDRNGTVIDCNRRLANLIGVKTEDLIGLNSLSSAKPTFRDWAREVLRGNEVKFTGRYVTALTDKELFISLFGFPIRNDEGVIIGAYALIEDLSSRQELERKLNAQRDFNKLIIETAGVLVAEITEDGNIIQVNTVLADILGRSRNELVGKPFSALLSTSSLELAKLLGSGLAKEAGPKIFEAHITDWKGEKRLISWKVSPYKNREDNDALYFLVIGTDITSQRTLQEKLREVQKMEAIGRLAGGVAHDFNNQLTAIMGYCQMLLMETDPKSETYRKLQVIKKAAKRAAETTNQLLAFSRKQALKPEKVSMNKAVGEACRFFERLLGEEIKVSFVPSKSDCTIEVDPGRFLQIFLNLALNSRDAMNGKGEIVVRTRVSKSKRMVERLKSETGKVAVIVFEDNGCGMEKEVLERAFEPFFTTKPLGQGTGLGLAMIYGTVKQSKGDIKLASKPGEGTKVTILFPVVKKNKGKYATSIQSLEAEKPFDGNGELVILLEDEDIVRSTVVEYLEKLNFTVEHFSFPSKLEGFLSSYEGTPPKIFITDVVMPEKDGIEVAEMVKKRFPEIKTIFMSGYSEQIVKKRGDISKAGQFLQKPFSIGDLKETLSRLKS